jgi:transposase
LDLYQGLFDGKPLEPNDFVISADEKRICLVCHEDRLPPGVNRIGRYDYQYQRHGTLIYLAALDVRTGRIIGQTAEKNGKVPFMSLVDCLMSTEPYNKANRVFWLVDNGSAHHRSTFGDRLAGNYSNAIAIHLPKHASWLNQIEIYFSILSRKLLKPSDFSSSQQLISQLSSFEAIYNKTARPFNWKFTKKQLEERFQELDSS